MEPWPPIGSNRREVAEAGTELVEQRAASLSDLGRFLSERAPGNYDRILSSRPLTDGR
jgi:hypothetical protein